MNILGGVAFFNQISFFSKNYRVTARKKGDNIIVTHSISKKSSDSNLNKLYEIPFMRGAARVLSMILRTKATVFLLLFIVGLEFLLDFFFVVPYLDYSYIHVKPIGMIYLPDVAMLVILILFLKVFIGKYHGAEHMVFNTYSENKTLTLDNVKKSSRVSQRCGSNLVIFILLFSFLFAMVLPFEISMLVSLSLGYEIFKSKRKTAKMFSQLFYKVGGLFQYLFFTSRPSTDQLEVALAAFNKLVELENKRVE